MTQTEKDEMLARAKAYLAKIRTQLMTPAETTPSPAEMMAGFAESEINRVFDKLNAFEKRARNEGWDGLQMLAHWQKENE